MVEAPWRTIGNPGLLFSIFSSMSYRRSGRLPLASGLSFTMPWHVPMEMARLSAPDLLMNSDAIPGSV